MEQLKPCPFCGEPMEIRTLHTEAYGDKHVLSHDNGGTQIVCLLFRGLTWDGSKEELITLWNRRVTDVDNH